MRFIEFIYLPSAKIFIINHVISSDEKAWHTIYSKILIVWILQNFSHLKFCLSIFYSSFLYTSYSEVLSCNLLLHPHHVELSNNSNAEEKRWL
ncbi:MAG: hypothetical protein CMF29_05630 [Kiritimatiellaceae bacterium]|nr:hypothetical protein [Kiritimatiellaceae bacterium]